MRNVMISRDPARDGGWEVTLWPAEGGQPIGDGPAIRVPEDEIPEFLVQIAIEAGEIRRLRR